MAFQQLLKVQNIERVDQKASGDGVSHRGFPACVLTVGRNETRFATRYLRLHRTASGGPGRSPVLCSFRPWTRGTWTWRGGRRRRTRLRPLGLRTEGDWERELLPANVFCPGAKRILGSPSAMPLEWAHRPHRCSCVVRVLFPDVI